MNFRSLRITPTLTLSVGLLVFLAVGLVLLIQWTTSRDIMRDLAGRLVVRNLEIVSQSVRGHLIPAQRQVEYLARLIEDGAYGVEDRQRLADLLLGSVAASPQIGGVVFINDAGGVVRVRGGQESGRYALDFPSLEQEDAYRKFLPEAKTRPSGYWGDLIHNPEFHTTFINYRRPLRRDGRFIGLIGAAVTVKEFSGLASRLSDLFGSTTFVMYGDDRVLAHHRRSADKSRETAGYGPHPPRPSARPGRRRRARPA